MKPWELLGAYDDSPSDLNLARLEQLEVPYLGTTDDLVKRGERLAVAVGVGNPASRRQLVDKLGAAGAEFPVLAHPTAVVGSNARIGPGAVVCAHVSIGTNVELGAHVHLNPHSVIGHDAVLEDFVSVNPNATVSGEVRLGSRTLVGAGAVILQGLSLGSDVTVGAAACVVRSAGDAETLVGVPAARRNERRT
jgi:sugar O-acyltransferase (sialic acid O-acetyltransferase NeuD family)